MVEEWVSAEEPHRIEKLAPGTYTLHEESAPEGYELAEDVEFEVEATGDVQTVTMEDEATPAPAVEGGEPFDKTGVNLAPLAAVSAAIAGGRLRMPCRRYEAVPREGRRRTRRARNPRDPMRTRAAAAAREGHSPPAG